MRITRTSSLLAVLLLAIGLTACGAEEADPPDRPDPEIINAPPTAAAGSDISAIENSTVVLDGSPSRDVEGEIVAYAWTVIEGPAVTIANSASATASFVAPAVSANDDHVDLIIELAVTDDEDAVGTDEIQVRVFDSNQRPAVVITGAPTSGDAFDVVVVDASGSADPDGSVVSFAWEQVNGPAGEIANGDTDTATLTLPDVTEEMLIQYRALVTDDEGKIGVGAVTILVRPRAASLAFVDLTGPANIEVDTFWPSLRVEVRNAAGERIFRGADAILDITVQVQPGTGTGVLSGTDERQAFQGIALFNDFSYNVAEDGLILWAQADGGAVEGFSPPINVVLTNQPPVVVADAPSTSVDALTAGVELIGTATDSDGSIVSRYWAQLEGRVVDLIDADTATASFDAPDVTAPTALVFRYSATDNGGKTRFDDVSVIIHPVAARLAFLTALPTPVAQDGIWAGVAVEVQNTSGERITGGAPASYLVELAPQAGAGDVGDLGGDLDVNAVAGLASFTDLFYYELHPGVILEPTVVSPPLSGVASTPVEVITKLPGAIGATGAAVWFDDAAPVGLSDSLFVGGFNTTTAPLDFGFAATGNPRASAGDKDGFVARYAAEGTLSWVSSFGGTGAAAQATAVATTATDDVLVAVRANGLVDFDDDPVDELIPTAFGDDDVVLAMLDGALGTVTWAVSIGGSMADRPFAVAHYGAGDNAALVAGDFTGSGVEFEPCTGSLTADSVGQRSAFAAYVEIDAVTADCGTAAATSWVYAATPVDGDSVITDLLVVGTSLYAVGTFTGTVEFIAADPRSPAAGAASHAFLMELDPTNGQPLWVNTFGGSIGTTTAPALAADDAGNIFVAGTFRGSADFDPGAGTTTLTATGEADGYVISFTSAGLFRNELAVSFGGAGSGDVVEIEALGVGDQAGDPIVLSGAIWGSVDLDPDAVGEALITPRAGESNGFLLGLTPTGGLDFHHAIGALSGNTGLDARCDALAVANPVSGLMVALGCRVGGVRSPYDVDPTSEVREMTPVGNLDATLAVLQP